MFKIVSIEPIPYEYRPIWFPAYEIPPEVRKSIVEKVPMKYQGFIYKKDHGFFQRATDKDSVYKQTYEEGLEDLKSLSLNELLHFKDLNKKPWTVYEMSKWFYFDPKSRTIMYSIYDTGISLGSAGGQTASCVVHIAKLTIVDVNGNVPNDICHHCQTLLYEEKVSDKKVSEESKKEEKTFKVTSIEKIPFKINYSWTPLQLIPVSIIGKCIDHEYKYDGKIYRSREKQDEKYGTIYEYDVADNSLENYYRELYQKGLEDLELKKNFFFNKSITMNTLDPESESKKFKQLNYVFDGPKTIVLSMFDRSGGMNVAKTIKIADIAILHIET